MSVLSVIAISLVWGAVVWSIPALLCRGRFSRISTPGPLLAAIAAFAGPLLLLVSGWHLPVTETGAAFVTQVVAGAELREFAEAAARTVTQRDEQGWGLEAVVLTVYGCGLAVGLTLWVRRFARLRTILRDARPVAGFQGRWSVLSTESPVPPFAVGGRAACIVLPEALLLSQTAQQIKMIVAHEEAHLRYNDPAVDQCLRLLCLVFWFNPFLLDLVTRWRGACELRADASALRGKDRIERMAYAEALIDALRLGATPAPISFTSRHIRNEKMRISAIMKVFDSARSRGWRLSVYCAVLLTGLAGTTVALSANADHVMTLEDFIPGGYVVAAYGIERKNRRDHTGVDVAARKGAEIAAPSDAVVKEATDLFRGNSRWGKAVVLELGDDVVVWLTHLESYNVKSGDKVKAGQVIATVGETGRSWGAHVHVETYRGLSRVNPVTVWPFLGQNGE